MGETALLVAVEEDGIAAHRAGDDAGDALAWELFVKVQSDALAELQREPPVNPKRIDAEFRDEVVTLAGQPKVSLDEVRAHIEQALNQRAGTHEQRISVAVRGADVTLTGTVHDWSERDLAAHSAWEMPGVRHVLDKLVVVR